MRRLSVCIFGFVVIAAQLSTASEAQQLPTLSDITREADGLVLAGKELPPDFLLRISRMAVPAERMTAVIYLRRAGLLTGPAISLDDVVFRRALVAAPQQDVQVVQPTGPGGDG